MALDGVLNRLARQEKPVLSYRLDIFRGGVYWQKSSVFCGNSRLLGQLLSRAFG